MTKIKRSHRLVDITQYLLSHPHQLISMTYFVDRFNTAKSSISEDVAIVKDQLQAAGVGIVETVSGVTGGVRFIPYLAKDQAKSEVLTIIDQLKTGDRILPGGYFYLTDILSHPKYLQTIGRVLATKYAHSGATAILTAATKGVPLAQVVSMYLGIPYVMARRDSKVTEGPTVSVNYVARTNGRVEKLEVTRSSLAEDSKVILIDDFLNSGGTIHGMLGILKEFNSQCVGVAVLCESYRREADLSFEFDSLIKLGQPNTETGELSLEFGSIFD
ncbi:transcriptional regulator [Aerococcus urinaehominis]|uniref:Transcriptional regulator n=1 Tax=Aerococcus urinaehominis TaxID=128944 RepID=A0A109RGU6_9LACT|nr:pur operon repressor [Aerococcus urinaehominis]AMB99548.1 transcriptional regulator [Aerococcus urinaehominis]SDM34680.1 purine operon repressor, PurR [Aerococcus urinaehominis]